jgi:hypothetical protein
MTYRPVLSSDARRPDAHSCLPPCLSAVTSLVGNGGRQYPVPIIGQGGS